MAKITFTADDGSVQEFDLGVLSTGTPVVIDTVQVDESNGSSETFVPEAAPADVPASDASVA